MSRAETAVAILWLAALGLAVGPTAPSAAGARAALQQQQEEEDPTRIRIPPQLGGQDDAQREMQELFARVERNLRAIDDFLFDAAAGDIPLALPPESGLDDLLRSTQERSAQAVQDMDRILEIAATQSPSGSGGSMGQQPPQQQGQSPLDEQRDSSPGDREQTPELPGGEQPPSSDPQQEPEGGDPQDPSPENHPNQPPSPTRQGPGSAADGAERWGELPVRVRQVFRSQGGGDMPVRYRDWIDGYYRRLNRQR